MISIKPGADVRRLRSELWDALYKIDIIYNRHGHDLVVTSGNDSKHSRGSFHYIDLAADIRTRNLKNESQRKSVFKLIKQIVGSDFDVILESDHIHIEFDPRRDRHRKAASV